jgi:DNA-binding MarR family transcriptional regulator
MTSANDDRLVNMLGAAAVGLCDAAVGDMTNDTALDAAAVAALVALLDLAQSGSVRALSQMVGLTHSGTVRLVNRLADANLIQRKPGPDGRTVAVTLTRRGRGVAMRVRTGRHAAIAAILAGLTERQRDQLATICETLVANLTSARLAARHAGRPPSGGALCRMCDPVACGRAAGECPAARTAAAAATPGRPSP